MPTSIKITADSKIVEVSEEQENAQMNDYTTVVLFMFLNTGNSIDTCKWKKEYVCVRLGPFRFLTFLNF